MFKPIVTTVLTTMLLFLSLTFATAGTRQGEHLVSAGLQNNAKLINAAAILADFGAGEPETAVIVRLRPSAAANALAAQARLSQKVPPEFSSPGAATYYNLRDESTKTQLRTTVTATVVDAIDQLGAQGITLTQRFSYQFGFAAKVTPEALERIVALPEVLAVEKDHILHAQLAQGIPLINASAVRGTYTGAGLSIAICDTGVDTSHPRLGGGGFPNSKVLGGYDTGDNDADPRPDSTSGEPHGTACAGIAAGDAGSTGDYVGGVAQDAKLYAIKISSGNSGSAYNSAMIAGWEWAVTHQNDDPANPIMIISTSFGGRSFASTCDADSPSMTTAAANAVAAGITIFAASGNDGYCSSMSWPACISYVNSVGAVYDGSLGTYGWCVNAASCATKEAHSGCSTGFVSWDTTASDKVTAYSNSASFLTLLAPSNNAHTSDIVGAGGYATGDYATTFGGTSAACPYAAGAAAVLQQAAKARTGAYLTPLEVKNYLTSNGDNLTDSKVAISKPRINLGKAIEALPAASVPVLQAEPATTAGTDNTIYWNALVFAPQPTSAPTGRPAVASLPTETSAARVEQDAAASSPVPRATTAGSSLVATKVANSLAQPATAPQPTAATLNQNKTGQLPLRPTKPAFTPTVLATTTILGETFEGIFPDSSWTLYGSPTWDDIDDDKHGGSWSAWCAASAVAPASGYPDNMNAWMVYGPFSLADATTAAGMSFWYRNLSETGYDHFKWLASVNGTEFYGYQVSGDQNTWRSQSFDLTSVPTLGDLRGQSQVWIAFSFSSNATNSGYTGAYVDDILITKEIVALPNLTPYQPAGWADKLVVAKTTGTATDDAPLSSTDALYVDWAILNDGTAATSARMYTELYVDDVLRTSWYTDPPLNPTYYVYVQDYALGTLTAGTHTIRIRTDATGATAESNEGDNEYTKTITISDKPNLTPYQPGGWSDKIVVAKTTGTTTDSSSLAPTDNVYVDWAVVNNGTTATTAQYFTQLFLDDTLKTSWYTSPPHAIDSYQYIQDYALGALAAGTHTVRIKTDASGAIAEINESDNEFTKTFTVTAPVVTEYYAECADNNLFAAALNSGWTTQTQWTFSDLTPGSTYWYRVKDRHGALESAWSNVEYSQQEGFDPNFTMAAVPSTLIFSQGASETANISTIVTGGFNAQVTLTATGLPVGVSASFIPTTIAAPGTGSSLLTLAATSSAAVGNSTVTITGGGGGQVRTTTLTLTIFDGIKPVVSTFAVPAVSKNTTVGVTAFIATDNNAVSGYLITESATPPAVDAPGWSQTPATRYTFASYGGKTLYAWAKDAAGNISVGKTAEITLVEPDITPPVLLVSSLPDGAWTNNDHLNVSGSAADNSGTVTVTVNGEPVPLAADGTFSTLLALVSGTNNSEVTAVDPSGNRTSDTRTILLHPQAPAITVALPPDNVRTAMSSIFVGGTVDATANLLLTDGQGETVVPERFGNNFSAPLALREGINTLLFAATDPFGNSATAKRTVVRDSLAPNLSVTVPNEDIIVRNGKLLLQGQVTDPLTPVTLAVTVNGTTLQPTVDADGYFGQDLTFPREGVYAVTVTATDDSDNQTSVTRNILYTLGLLRINGDAAYTKRPTVTLNLSYYPSFSKMRLCYNNRTWTDWQTLPTAFETTKTVLLPASNGLKTIYVQFMDADGNESEIYFDSINLDTIGPKGQILLDNGAPLTTDSTVDVSLTANDSSGIAAYQFTENVTIWPELWTPFAPSAPYTFTSLQDGTKTLYARFRDSAGKISATVSDAILYKKNSVPPTVATGSISLASAKSSDPAGYATSKDVKIAVTVPSLLYTKICFSNNGSTWSPWEPVKTAKSWALADGDGQKSVYARFKTSSNLESAVYGDTIVLDTKAPMGTILINAGAPVTASTDLQLTLDAADRSGVDAMQFSENGLNWSVWETFGTQKNHPLTLTAASDGVKTVQVRFRDIAGNISTAKSDTIRLDRLAPTGKVVINAGAASTGNPLVALSLPATGAVSMQIKLDDDVDWPSWQPYVATRKVLLPSGLGPKTVQVRFRDLAGNLSPAASDSILLK